MVRRYISVVSIRSLTSLLLSSLVHRAWRTRPLCSLSCHGEEGLPHRPIHPAGPECPTLAKNTDAPGKIRRWARRDMLRSGGHDATSDWPTILPSVQQLTTVRPSCRSSCSIHTCWAPLARFGETG